MRTKYFISRRYDLILYAINAKRLVKEQKTYKVQKTEKNTNRHAKQESNFMDRGAKACNQNICKSTLDILKSSNLSTSKVPSTINFQRSDGKVS